MKTQMLPTQPTRAHWGCYGSEALTIPFINFTDELFEDALNVALYVHSLPCLYIQTYVF
jgi:hypothetical protein